MAILAIFVVATFFVGWGIYMFVNAKDLGEGWGVRERWTWWVRIWAVLFFIAGAYMLFTLLW